MKAASLRGPLLLFSVLVAASAGLSLGMSGALPPRVASHFGFGGAANGFMSREGYLTFILLFGCGFPLLIVLLVGGIPRLVPNLTNVPNREYWFAPERRAEALSTLTRMGIWLGCLFTVFFSCLNWLVVVANRQEPPRLPEGLFYLLLGSILAGVGIWIAVLFRRFRLPAPSNSGIPPRRSPS